MQLFVSLKPYCLRNRLSGKNVYEHFKRHPVVYGVLHGALLSRSLAIEYIKSGLLMKQSFASCPPTCGYSVGSVTVKGLRRVIKAENMENI